MFLILLLSKKDNTAIVYISSIKRSQLIFVHNFIKNQWILMQFSLLDLEVSGIFDIINFTHFTCLMLLHYL